MEATENAAASTSLWRGTGLAAVGAIVLALSYSVFLLDRPTVIRLGTEDGLFENLTSLFFFVAGVILLVTFWRHRRGNDFVFFRTRRNVWLLLLALLLLFGAGEEISWGQRVFGWKTPETFHSNLQYETNLHNLEMFHRRDETGAGKSGLALLLSVERLFSLFWATWCVLVPVLHLASRRVARELDRFQIPIVPLAVGVMFPVTYLVSKVFERNPNIHPDVKGLLWAVFEIKEFVFAFLFALIALYFLRSKQLVPMRAADQPAAIDEPARPEVAGASS